jgi:FeS assembly SUF system protein
MMNLFRKKRPAEQQPEPASPPKAVEPPPSPAAAPPSYEPWSPEGPPGAIDGGGLAPQLIEAAPEAAETLPTPPGLSPDHPLAGQIARALSSVYDPEIPVDIYQLGLVYDVALNEANDARISMTLTTPGCPVAGSMPAMVEYAVASMVEGIGDVEVELVWDPPWNPDMMSEAAQLELGFM